MSTIFQFCLLLSTLFQRFQWTKFIGTIGTSSEIIPYIFLNLKFSVTRKDEKFQLLLAMTGYKIHCTNVPMWPIDIGWTFFISSSYDMGSKKKFYASPGKLKLLEWNNNLFLAHASWASTDHCFRTLDFILHALGIGLLLIFNDCSTLQKHNKIWYH